MKLRDPYEFLKQTSLYNILPTNPPLWLNLTAIVVPYLELLCAVALILGFWRRGAALIVAGMLLFFTPMLFVRALGMYAHPAAGVTYSWFCAVKFDCGCGTGEVFICRKLAENIGLLLGALIVLFSASSRFCLSGWFIRPRSARGLQPEPVRT